MSRDALIDEPIHFYEVVPADREDLPTRAMLAPRLPGQSHKHLHIDVGPIIEELVDIARGMGIPLTTVENLSGKRVGVSASFKIGTSLPAVRFHARERSACVFGAFYPDRSSLRTAFVWPVRQFTVRLEGGDDSELGYFAIAGAQWLHPRRPWAVGIGVPVKLRQARGPLGFVLQIRMKLD